MLASFKAGQITAMLDISDGLSVISHIYASVAAAGHVWTWRLPLSTPLSHVAQALQHDPLTGLCMRRDYELLFTLQLHL
ncbi:hypothetical protein KSZ_78510 [Dictyobacter formicarum]|uniref:Uncharacterized protein n=1 Tax=Dictyobacter formicarum TaxID=2778368 RepID=A0ABQ3VUC9_9CHLR|nr:hypothetical protein KSZ_78510 [Dictyobacter formicarum]